jgi:replicative DNA helicase
MSIKMKTYDQNTERKILNLMLYNESAIELVLSIGLNTEDFAIERNQNFFNKMVDIYIEQAVAVGSDLDIIINRMEYDDEEDKKQCILSLTKLSKMKVGDGDEVPMKLLPAYVKELKDLALVRRVVRGVQGITRCLNNENSKVEDLTSSVEQLNNVMLENDGVVRMNMKDAVNETVKELMDEAESDEKVKFYIDELDEKAKILKGYLTYIAGSAGIGKSAEGLNLAFNITEHKGNVLYATNEMNIPDCVKKMIAMKEGINSQRLLNPKLLKAKDWKTIEQMLEDGELPSYNIYWSSKASMTVKELKSEIVRNVKLHDIDTVIIDYYQLLKLEKDSTLPESVEIPRVSNALKVMASEAYINPDGKLKKISIIALSQLVKTVEYRENKRPTMDDLYYGGAKDARLVIGLYRDEYYNPDTTTKPNIMEFGILKQNNGIMNEWVDTFFDYNTFKIRPLTEDEKELIAENTEDEDDEEEEEEKPKKVRHKREPKKEESDIEDDEDSEEDED